MPPFDRPTANQLRLKPRGILPCVLALSLLLAVSGCGFVRIPYGDFAITVTPATSTVAAGIAAPAYSFAISPVNGFNGPVTVTSIAPSGITCAPISCTAVISSAQANNALQFKPGDTFPAGTLTLTFIATSGTLSHSTTATLTVTSPPNGPPPSTPPPAGPPIAAPPPPPLANCAIPVSTTVPSYHQTGYVYTGDPNPTGIAYDAIHNQIFITNLQLNEIDVISPETMAITQRLPIPQPMGIDLTLDGSTLIIGTETHYFYRASTAPLCVTGREYLPIMPSLGFNLRPEYPTALADGSILFASYDVASTAQSIYRWSSANGFQQPPGLGQLAYSVRNIVPSRDRRHAFISGDDSGGVYGRFDLDTGNVVAQTIAFGSQPTILAVNQDGSRVLINNDCCGMTLTDSNFNTLSTHTGIYVEGALGETDFSRIYVKDISSGFVTVLDGTNLTTIGSLPASFVPVTFARTEFKGFDGSHRLLTVAADGLTFLDTSNIGAILALQAPVPTIRIGGGAASAFVPSTPANGYNTTLNGANFQATSSVLFSEGVSSHLATAVTTASASGINLTAPAFPSGCADVSALFSRNSLAFAPQAYCYSPTIYFVDGDAGPASGGGVLTLYGQGFGYTTPTVTIGGVTAQHVTLAEGYADSVPFQFSTLQVTVPPGAVGPADVIIGTSFGSTILRDAYTYAQRSDFALPSGAQPVQLILDSVRGRILATDAANNQILIYSLASGTLIQSVPTGASPQGVALTPDGTGIILATAGDHKLSVFDASDYLLLQQVAIPADAPNIGPPVSVAALAGSKALVTTQAGYLQGPAGPYSNAYLLDYDLGSNTVTLDSANSHLYTGTTLDLTASADGSTALVQANVFHAFGGPDLSADVSALRPFFDSALSSDGKVNAIESYVVDGANHQQTTVTAPAPISDPPVGDNFLAGEQLNSSGSLLYRPTPAHIRIYDTQNGSLRRTLEVPDGILGSISTSLLAVNPAGQQLVIATASGISAFTFTEDPLAIGEVQLSGTLLTVVGSGFDSAMTLSIDSIPVSVTVDGSTRLTATLPQLASGPHSVTITIPAGHQFTRYLAFTTP
jgi:streptogramin lyase